MRKATVAASCKRLPQKETLIQCKIHEAENEMQTKGNDSRGCLIFVYNQHTVPAMETTIVPYNVPNSNPADIVKGTAGMAST
jgi:hypothetical protein